MKINKIQINGYGKLKDTKFKLNKGINIIYGKNEVGKSTLLNYITNSLYGISRNKNGREMSDFEKYKPWDNEEFSGKLEYELDNGNKYEVFRDFKKKSPKIYNKKAEDISKEFNIDKTKGNQFFYEQTRIDEDLFKSTFLVQQQEVKLENKEQHMLIQKISNLVGTGEDNVSYKLAMDRLNRKQLDEVGTTRSREKPINKVTKEIERLQSERGKLRTYENEKYEIEEEKKEIIKEIEELEIKNEIAKEVKKIKEKEILENEKIKIQENLENENNKKINEIKEEKNEIENQEKIIIEKNKKIKNKIKKLKKKIIFILIIFIILNILQFILIKNKYFNYIFLPTVPAVLIFYIFSKNKLKNKIKKEEINKLKIEKNKLENEINIINENNKKIKDEKNKIHEKINLEKNLEKEKIKNKYKLEINNLINEKNIEIEIEKIQNLINENRIKLREYEIDKKNIETNLDFLATIEEDLVVNKERYVNLLNKSKSIELAKEVLTNSYQKMKEEVTPKFTKQLSENIGIITKGKYTKAMYNEEKGLIIELKNGNYVTANKLSLGTIDQLYLSLRLSMIDDLSDEKLPIILDESFAFYDNERLRNILKYLTEKFAERQIIIFTCTKREKEILEKENINYNLIEM